MILYCEKNSLRGGTIGSGQRVVMVVVVVAAAAGFWLLIRA